MPITLIDASTRAGIATGLQSLAASFHATTPCHAQTLSRVAQQITDSYTAAQAVSNYTTLPALNTAINTAGITTANLDNGTVSTRNIGDPSYAPFP